MLIIYRLNKKTAVKVGKFVAAIVATMILMFSLYFYFTAALVSRADEFFQSIKNRSAEQSMAYLSADFKKQVPPDIFKQYIETTDLVEYKSSSWTSRSIKSNRGSLAGIVKTKYASLPATITFVKEQEQWKIYSLQIRSQESQDNKENRELPKEQEQLLLSNNTIKIFIESVKQKSMQHLYETSAAIWQKHVNVSELDTAFASFYKEEPSLLEQVTRRQPVFEHRAKLDDEGFMLIAGHYQLDEQLLSFKQRYIYEALGWSLVGLDIKLIK